MKKLTKPDFITCNKCGETKPRAEFKRRLTAEQYSKALNRRVETGTSVISSLCKPCQPKRKPRAKLTLKELRNKITNKRINPYLGELLIEEKRKAINATRKRNMKIRWQKEKGKERAELKASLDKEVNRAKSTYSAYKRRTESCPIKPNRQNGWADESKLQALEQERLAHLAVLLTQYRFTQQKRKEKLEEYDQRNTK